MYTNFYKKIYETTLKIKVEKGFAIHHIDFNRENNVITNLVAMPRGLHTKYHLALQSLREFNFSFSEELYQEEILGSNFSEIELSYTVEYFKYLKRFLLCKIECSEYIRKRNELIAITLYR